MESFVANLKQDAQCSLCSDTLIEPKILGCFHTFCKLCIKRNTELIDQLNVFQCPKCSAETSLKELNSVDELKTSLLHSRIVEVLVFVESDKVCGVCKSCSSWHCFDCDRSMCDECETNHSQFTKDHKLVSLAELKTEDLEFMLTRENSCEYHSNRVYQFYCKDCDRCICVKCLESQHFGHDIIKVADNNSNNKAAMQENLKELEVKVTEMKKQVETLKEMSRKTKQNGDRAKKDVRETMEQLFAFLQENEQDLVQQIEQRIKKAERMQTKGQCAVDQTQGALDYLTKLIEKGLVSERNAVNAMKSVDIPNKDETDFMFVGSKELKELQNAGIGDMRTITDHTKSTVEVEAGIEALKKAKLILLSKTCTGHLNYNPGDVVDIKVIPEDDVKIEKGCVTTGGKTEIEFIPRVACQLTAEVKVNGNHVSNSPLVITVKPQQMTTRQFMMNGIKRKGPKKLTGVAVNKDNTRIAVVNEFFHCVHVFSTGGNLLLTYGSYGSRLGQLSQPDGLAFLNDTILVIADWGNDRICIVNITTGTLVKIFGHHGNGDGEFDGPYGVHVDDGCNIIVSDNGNHRVQVFNKDGDYQYQFGLTEQGSFDPVSTVTHCGLFYVSDSNNSVIYVFEKKGDIMTRISTIGQEGIADDQMYGPRGLAIDNNQNLLVCDRYGHCIHKLTLDGRYVGKTCDRIHCPLYIAVLNDGQLLVTNVSGVYIVQ